jgi:hypothetical protein
MKARAGEKSPAHGNGEFRRQWLSAPDAFHSAEMPKRDLPDREENDGNLVDLREHLLRRAARSDGGGRVSSARTIDLGRLPTRQIWRRRRPRFTRFDAMWIGLIGCIGFLL